MKIEFKSHKYYHCFKIFVAQINSVMRTIYTEYPINFQKMIMKKLFILEKTYARDKI